MKTSSIYISLTLWISAIACFGFQVSESSRRSSTSLNMGMFDFKPFHGSGSASNNDLDEQWRLQQKKLEERRDHLDKAHLKEKYRGGEGKFEVHATKQATQSHMDDMYIDDNYSHQKQEKKAKGFKLKFPWEK